MIELRCPWCGTTNRIPDTRAGSPARCGRCGQPLATTLAPVGVTDANFEAIVTRASAPVLLDCWADWCGPCHALAPTIDDIARAHGGRLVVGKLDVDANPETASRFAAMGWVDAADYRRSRPDPLSDAAAGIMEHMNRDHADALVAYARFFAGAEADEASMTAVDRLGFKLHLRQGGRRWSTRVAFPREVRTADDSRGVLIEMLKQARGQS